MKCWGCSAKIKISLLKIFILLKQRQSLLHEPSSSIPCSQLPRSLLWLYFQLSASCSEQFWGQFKLNDVVFIMFISITFLTRGLSRGFSRHTRSSLHGSTTTTVRLSAYDVIMQMVYCKWNGFTLKLCPRGHSTKLFTGSLRPEVQTLTLFYTFFDRKGTPFVSLPLYPFHTPTERSLPNFSLEKPLLPYLDESAGAPFSRYFESSFKHLNDSFLIPFLYLNLWNPYPFIYLQPEKGTLLGRSLPVLSIIGSTPPRS